MFENCSPHSDSMVALNAQLFQVVFAEERTPKTLLPAKETKQISMNTASKHKIVLHPTLSFLATLAFVATFLVVRTFTTIYPWVIVEQGGIHFHHFWYGLAMIATAGWLGIAWRRGVRLDRIYAIVYGVGAGLVGDEIGLLLTFNDYRSTLTFNFFIGAVSFAILVILLLRYGERLRSDISELGRSEGFAYLGIFIAGVSSVLFATSFNLLGVIAAILGLALIILGVEHHRRVSA